MNALLIGTYIPVVKYMYFLGGVVGYRVVSTLCWNLFHVVFFLSMGYVVTYIACDHGGRTRARNNSKHSSLDYTAETIFVVCAV